jgi:hypothetical protein
MKKVTLVLSLLLAVMTVVAQTDNKQTSKAPPDFSGTWILDEAKSNTGSGKDKITEYTLTIISNGPEIRMSKRYKQGGQDIADEAVLYTDGRPEYNSRTGRADSAPITRWQGRKLVRRSSASPLLDGATNRSGFSMNFVTTDEWELSKDSNTLTRRVITTAGATVSLSNKYVFNRKS